jgi:hypothetical protein
MFLQKFSTSLPGALFTLGFGCRIQL